MSIGLNDNCHQESRILIWSQRNIQNFNYNSCLYEFEDIIYESDRVDILAPLQYNLIGRSIKKIIKNQTKYFKPLVYLNPSLQGSYLEKEYDILFTVVDFPWNIASINSLKNWRKKSKFAVCYIIEIWQTDIPKLKNFIEFLQDFDLICLGHSQVVEKIKKLTDRPCIYLAPGVDTIKFFPNLKNNNRCIDVCSLGRRSNITHQALLALAERNNFFYYYDGTMGAESRNNNYQEHRTLIANLLKNSRYFITNYAKVNEPEQTQGQIEIGYRFFEGAAAGNILIGCPPKNEAFEEYFDWQNAVLPMAFDEPKIADLIKELDRDTEYLFKIQTNNVINSLRKHDWVYRWEQVLNKLGLSPTKAIESRKSHLRKLAQSCEELVTVNYRE
ncbi:MAG: glycosyltransferase [Pleurocapsa sp.]